MTYSTLSLDWPSDGVARVRLTRESEMNSLRLELLEELDRAIDEATAGRARVLIITGTDRAFCCRAHLKYFAGPETIFTDRFETRDRYFGRNARVGLPEAKLGATPGAGCVQKLARYIGRAKALEWIMLARHVDAAEAAAAGLVYRVVEPDEVDDASLQLAQDLMVISPRALAQCKASIHVSGDVDLRSARRFGVEALSALVDCDDWREGMSAFIEKRPSNFGTTLKGNE
jgi:enoyl-CoA hydratase/carnithine racemase